MNLDIRFPRNVQECDDEDFSFERDSFEYDDCPYHAPSAFVENQRLIREERLRRDREDLVVLWREEQRQRRRENAARYLPAWKRGRD